MYRKKDKKSNRGSVYLWKTDISTEGRFRCEVSADAPFFQTVIKEAEMHVYCKYNKDNLMLHSFFVPKEEQGEVKRSIIHTRVFWVFS